MPTGAESTIPTTVPGMPAGGMTPGTSDGMDGMTGTILGSITHGVGILATIMDTMDIMCPTIEDHMPVMA